jgi:hypothetical protein
MKKFFFILPGLLFMLLMLPCTTGKCLAHLPLVIGKGYTSPGNDLLPAQLRLFTAPDISLGCDITGNTFTANSNAQTIVYNIAEIGGTDAVGDTLRITRVAGYNLSFNFAASSAVVNGTTYILDNFRWKIDNSNPAFFSLILIDQGNSLNPGTMLANHRIYLAVVLTRYTPDISSFTLSATVRKANGELNLSNNMNSVVFSAE